MGSFKTEAIITMELIKLPNGIQTACCVLMVVAYHLETHLSTTSMSESRQGRTGFILTSRDSIPMVFAHPSSSLIQILRITATRMSFSRYLIGFRDAEGHLTIVQ